MTDLAIAASDLAHADTNEPLPRQQAIVNCVLYQEGRRVKDLAVEECGAFTGSDGAVVWLGVHEPDADLLETVRQQFALHELIIEDANQAHQRPKMDVYGDVLFIVLRTAQLISGKIQYGETHLVVGKGFVVSIRHGA